MSKPAAPGPRVSIWREWMCECCGKTWAHYKGRLKPKHKAADCPAWGVAGENWGSVRRTRRVV